MFNVSYLQQGGNSCFISICLLAGWLAGQQEHTQAIVDFNVTWLEHRCWPETEPVNFECRSVERNRSRSFFSLSLTMRVSFFFFFLFFSLNSEGILLCLNLAFSLCWRPFLNSCQTSRERHWDEALENVHEGSSYSTVKNPTGMGRILV